MAGHGRTWGERTAVLLLAGIVMTGFAGKELPRAFGDRRQVTGCEALGPDFHKLEGSDTCVRFSGSVRMEVGVGTGGSGSPSSTRR